MVRGSRTKAIPKTSGRLDGAILSAIALPRTDDYRPYRIHDLGSHLCDPGGSNMERRPVGE